MRRRRFDVQMVRSPAKRGRPPRTMPVPARAEPTRERMQRAGTDFVRGASGQITMRDSPLERALARKLITQEQYSAAQKYRHHWYHAGLCDPLAKVDLSRIFPADFGVFSGMAKTETQVFHRQRYREAVQATGKIRSHVLEWTVCREMGLEQAGYALGWSGSAQAYAAAAERMKVALEQLCELWGIGK